MKRAIEIIVIAAAFVGHNQGQHKNAASSQEPDDLKAIQGNWTLVQIQAGGINMIRPKGKDSLQLVTFKDDSIYFQKEFSGKITLDSTKMPKHLNLVWMDKLTEGIYKIDGDTLVICWADVKGVERPKELKTEIRSGTRLLTMKRNPNLDQKK